MDVKYQPKLSLLETRFSYSKHTFLTRNLPFLLETHFSYSKLTFLTRNLPFLLETRFSYSKLTFLTRNSLSLLETRFSYSKLAFFLLETRLSYLKLAFLNRNSLSLTRNSLFLLETHFSYSKLTFLTQNSPFLLETRFSFSKLTFLTRNSLFLLKTRLSYSKLAFVTRNSLSLLENSLPTKSESHSCFVSHLVVVLLLYVLPTANQNQNKFTDDTLYYTIIDFYQVDIKIYQPDKGIFTEAARPRWISPLMVDKSLCLPKLKPKVFCYMTFQPLIWSLYYHFGMNIVLHMSFLQVLTLVFEKKKKYFLFCNLIQI